MKKTFTTENFNNLKATCAKITALADENLDGDLMAAQLICLGEGIKEFMQNPIVVNSGIQIEISPDDIVVDGECKYIGQALMKTWKAGKENDTAYSGMMPLEHFLKYNYNERYVKLCDRIGIKPVSFGAWLRKPIQNIK